MNELTFLDLVVMLKVDAESTVEKFGSAINTSFFETANLLGTMKMKGYLDIMSSIGGMSRVVLTDAGASIITLAKEKSSEPIDILDNSILGALASGVRDSEALAHSLNIRAGDLAYHLHKLYSQQYIDYTVRSAKVSVSLTEKGFNAAGGSKGQVQPVHAAKANPITGSTQTVLPSASSSKPESAQSAPAQPSTSSTGVVAATATASSPPWVDKSLVSVSEASTKVASEDVRDLLSHPAAQHAKHAKHKEAPHAEKKRDIKTERALSKLSYYARQYLFYGMLVLLFVAILLFAIGAAYIKLK